MLLTVDLERLDVRAGQRLLDAGCGEGRHCFGALEKGADVVGLDLDYPSLRAAVEGPARAVAKSWDRSARCFRATPSTCPSPTTASTR